MSLVGPKLPIRDVRGSVGIGRESGHRPDSPIWSRLTLNGRSATLRKESDIVRLSAIPLRLVDAMPLQQSRSDAMNPRISNTLYLVAWVVSLFTAALPPAAAAEPGQFIVSPVAEKKLSELPPGPLYWRIENFPTLEQAQNAAAASPTSLAAAVSDKFWLFTLGQKGARRPAASKSLRLARCQSSWRPNICCGSITLAVRPAPKHPCIHILAPVVLCACWSGRPKNTARGEPHGSGAVNGWPRPGHAHGGVQQWNDRPGSTGDVSLGRDQTGLGAGQA